MNSITSLTPQQLRRAADLQERIGSLQKELGQILGATPPAAHPANAAPARRRLSASAIANIRAGARRRWAQVHRAQPSVPAASSVIKPRRKITAAGRARLAALARERWKKAKAQGKATL